MFKGKLKVEQDGPNIIASVCVATPSGRIFMVRGKGNLNDGLRFVRVNEKDIRKGVGAEKVAGAVNNYALKKAIESIEQVMDFFSMESITNAQACAHAKELFLAMQSTDPPTSDMAKLRVVLIRRLAGMGNSQAQDATYCLRRLAKEEQERRKNDTIVGWNIGGAWEKMKKGAKAIAKSAIPALKAIAPLAAGAISFVPGVGPLVGPMVQKGLNLLDKASSASKAMSDVKAAEDAKKQLTIINQLASAGVPKAQEAQKAIVQAQALRAVAKAGDIIEAKEKGLTVPVESGKIEMTPIRREPTKEENVESRASESHKILDAMSAYNAGLARLATASKQ